MGKAPLPHNKRNCYPPYPDHYLIAILPINFFFETFFDLLSKTPQYFHQNYYYYAIQSILKTLCDNICDTAKLNIHFVVSTPSKSVWVVSGPLLWKDPLCIYSCKRPPPGLTATECSHFGWSFTGGSIVLSTHRDYWQINVFPKVRKQRLNVGDFRTYGFPFTGLWITHHTADHSYIHFYLFHSFKNKGTLIFSHQQTSREVKSHRQAIRKTNWYRGL